VFNIHSNYYRFDIRLSGIDTPEIRSKDLNEKKQAIIVRDFLRDKILDKIVILECKDFDKYGRLLADIYLSDEFGNPSQIKINDLLVNNNYARLYNGGKKIIFADW
jgi:endonuclease YncB( thermonuclease family)